MTKKPKIDEFRWAAAYPDGSVMRHFDGIPMTWPAPDLVPSAICTPHRVRITSAPEPAPKRKARKRRKAP